MGFSLASGQAKLVFFGLGLMIIGVISFDR